MSHEEESKKIALLKVTLISVHELVQKEPLDIARIKAQIEEAFDKLHMQVEGVKSES